MKLRVFTIILSILLTVGCKKTPIPNTPEAGVVSKSFFSVVIGGAVSGINILDKGVCWGANENPDRDGNSISAGSGADPFQVMIPNLASQTKYFARTYVTNEAGTVYSNNILFTTLAAVGLTTSPVSSVGSSSAICGGIIGSSLTFTPSERGICWSTLANPQISDNKSVSTISTTSSFTATLGNLSTSTLYYVRAYASSSLGVVYGNEINFRTYGDPVTDVDGNKYKTITIGTQVWMAENLKVTKYRNGDAIPYLANDAIWALNGSDAYGYYDNSTANRAKFGNLYNYLAISADRKLAPEGWHIPSKTEWETLIAYLGGQTPACPKLMSDVLYEWPSYSTTTITNETRFTALPGGSRDYNGSDGNFGYEADYWTTTSATGNFMYAMRIDGSNATPFMESFSVAKNSGYYVRCIKD